jgi:putative RNA 2'-phosphotransferase
MTRIPHALVKLDKMLSYVLGRRPDEFGLVPDQEGYVKIKDLLKAINEEDGWKHIRRSSIDEILLTAPCPSIEIKETLIRAVTREKPVMQRRADHPPKLLYVGIRHTAWPHVMKNGLSSSAQSRIILADHREFAERMGKRIHQEPVVLTIQVHQALGRGVVFDQTGRLFLTDFIPPDCIAGPPLPKEKPETQKSTWEDIRKPDQLPGSFIIRPVQDKTLQNPYKRKKKENEPIWKKDRNRAKRRKEKSWKD